MSQFWYIFFKSGLWKRRRTNQLKYKNEDKISFGLFKNTNKNNVSLTWNFKDMDEFWNSEKIKRLKSSAWTPLGGRRIAHAINHFWNMKTSFLSTKPFSDLRWGKYILGMYRAFCVTVSEGSPPCNGSMHWAFTCAQFQTPADKCLHILDLLVLSCILCSSIKQVVKWHFLKEWEIALFLRCNAGVQMENTWASQSSALRGSDKSLHHDQKA